LKQQPPNWYGRDLGDWFQVSAVWPTNLFVVEEMNHNPNGTRTYRPFVLKNYPRHDKVIDGERIHFFALRTGNYQWTNQKAETHTLPLYDYGTPYNPFAQRQSPTAPASSTPATTRQQE
jgi:hypothetical protein